MKPIGFIGIDTSNYTTSAALYTGEEAISEKRLLKVAHGEAGLRQSDALFQHTKNLPEVVASLSGANYSIQGVGVSDRPREAVDSYMPCFLAGVSAASSTATLLGVPLLRFPHQSGHIAAVLYGAQRLELIENQFIAFHVSGGTTEAVLVTPDEHRVFSCRLVASSLDLKAGQAIDRTGIMLGLDFPAGAELDVLSRAGNPPKGIRATMRDGNCCISGIQNICERMLSNGAPREDIARCCIEFIRLSLLGMAEKLLSQYGDLPMIFSGGVSSNSIIREDFTKRFGAVFASSEFSCDNAVGTAVLTYISLRR